MSFLTELQARRKRGPGSVEVYFEGDDKPLVVPLRYPTAASQAEIMAYINEMDAETRSDSLEQNTQLVAKVIRACIDSNDDITDEDLLVLIRESGGFEGVLARRCNQLIGFGGSSNNKSRIIKGGKRGR